MTREDILDWYKKCDREVDELLAEVARLARVRNHPGMAASDAHFRFERSLAQLRDLDEDMHLARCDLIIASRRIGVLFTRNRPREWYRRWDSVQFAWTEFRNSCRTYWLFATKAYKALRAALKLIFLRE
jgi:hypothetical protein